MEEFGKVIILVIYLVFFIIVIFGNVFVVYLVLRMFVMKSFINFFLVNMVVVDIFFVVFMFLLVVI